MAVNIVRSIDGGVRVKNVLASVSDKRGLDKFMTGLLAVDPKIRIYSTGGTYQALKAALGTVREGKNLLQVSDYTGQPEMQGGLVKTLDFKIYMGLLSETYNEAHRADLKRVGGVCFDMVVVNLYPFAQTVASGASPEAARANIDIGGPCMVRAAAKNFLRVAPVTDPDDYAALLDELAKGKGIVSLARRYELARKAFAHTAAYDAAIAAYLARTAFDQVKSCYEVK